MWIIGTYLTYLFLSILLTIWVARTLHHNGRTFLLDAFHGSEELADSVNHLLVVGFYLINFGYIALALKTYQPVTDFRQALELESTKAGLVMLILGILHFGNIFLLQMIRFVGAFVPRKDRSAASAA